MSEDYKTAGQKKEPTLVRLCLEGVDPLAVYSAERQLRKRGKFVSRKYLAAYYSATGMLRPFVDDIVNSEGCGDEADIRRVLSESIVKVGMERADNPLLENPAGWAVLYTGCGVAFGCITFIIGLLTTGIRPTVVFYAGSVVYLLITALASTAYALIGARRGRQTARQIVCGVLGVGIVGFAYFFARATTD